MSTSSIRSRRRRLVVAASLGLLLVGSAAAPALAESTRSTQWHLDAMHAEEMWKVSTGKGVTVALLDSGVDVTHPDLQGQILPGKDFTSEEPGSERTDTEGHGTGMAGVIAGTGKLNGGNGAFGLAPGVKILPVRLADTDLSGSRQDQADEYQKPVSEAIRYAADQGAKVINISQGVIHGSPQLTSAVKYALDKGSLIFAAVGNEGDTDIEYPAATPGVVGIGAIGKDGKKTQESQHGPLVDFVAPGWDIVASCTKTTRLCKTSGTSDATALASASAALIWSQHPTWTNNQVLRVMLNTAGSPRSGEKRTDFLGYGTVRPRIALKTPGDPGPAGEYPLPDLAAAAPESPSTQPSKASGGTESDKKQPDTAAPASHDDSNTGLWIALGVGAAALIGAAVAALVIRSRRRVAVSSPASPVPDQQQPQFPAYGPPQAGQGQSPQSGPGQPG
ncbi:type VII secretion-associated serine protease mycosin [Streptomyces sp. NBC_01750]|uniref:type VII secretion-associated serine protease mycosin n=1 Tax=Streptomyces sp. NBC_01750 TaxID=2975928 RepID=UPI002DDA8C50|nr:type VII secretion-associated serine protease mycosin [Streptomyces sp. NBC_01750]WSD33185.1 type VII secretion-associated serine protease mycosin [Streptomyces sp. NBC_01750]